MILNGLNPDKSALGMQIVYGDKHVTSLSYWKIQVVFIHIMHETEFKGDYYEMGAILACYDLWGLDRICEKQSYNDSRHIGPHS